MQWRAFFKLYNPFEINENLYLHFGGLTKIFHFSVLLHFFDTSLIPWSRLSDLSENKQFKLGWNFSRQSNFKCFGYKLHSGDLEKMALLWLLKGLFFVKLKFSIKNMLQSRLWSCQRKGPCKGCQDFAHNWDCATYSFGKEKHSFDQFLNVKITSFCSFKSQAEFLVRTLNFNLRRNSTLCLNVSKERMMARIGVECRLYSVQCTLYTLLNNSIYICTKNKFIFNRSRNTLLKKDGTALSKLMS